MQTSLLTMSDLSGLSTDQHDMPVFSDEFELSAEEINNLTQPSYIKPTIIKQPDGFLSIEDLNQLIPEGVSCFLKISTPVEDDQFFRFLEEDRFNLKREISMKKESLEDWYCKNKEFIGYANQNCEFYIKTVESVVFDPCTWFDKKVRLLAKRDYGSDECKFYFLLKLDRYEGFFDLDGVYGFEELAWTMNMCTGDLNLWDNTMIFNMHFNLRTARYSATTMWIIVMLKILGRRAKRRMTRPTRIFPELLRKIPELPAQMIATYLEWSFVVKAVGQYGPWYEYCVKLSGDYHRNRYWMFDSTVICRIPRMKIILNPILEEKFLDRNKISSLN